MKHFSIILIVSGVLFAQPDLKTADSLFQCRKDKASLLKAIDAYKQIFSRDSTYYSAEKVCRSLVFLADNLMEGEDGKKKVYWEAYEWGCNALETDVRFKKAFIDDDKAIDDAVKVLGKDHIGAMFWSANALGMWARENGILFSVKQGIRAKGIIKHLLTIDKHYFYGGPVRWMASFYANAPSMFGGDMDKAKINYEEALENSPDFFSNSILMAEFYARKNKDYTLYNKLLDDVLSKNPDILPEVEPEQYFNKIRAQKMKDRK
jgi:tetratricopeptide (TPR) repeat protein